MKNANLANLIRLTAKNAQRQEYLNLFYTYSTFLVSLIVLLNFMKISLIMFATSVIHYALSAA